MTKPEAVIFDLDGCLVDSEPHSLAAIAAEMRVLGIADADPEAIRHDFLGVSMRDICRDIAGRHGVAVPDDFAERVERRLFAVYAEKLARIDGATALLDRLGAEGVAMAIATGGSVRRLGVTLEHGGLGPFFAGRAFSAEQVARGKPAPDLFLHAADALGIAPGACVVLEDSPHGIAGARAAGMRAVGFTGGTHLDGIRDAHAARLTKAGAARVVDRLDFAHAALMAA